MTLGEKIKFARKKASVSEDDFAGILNISKDIVQKWESDSIIPETEKLIMISNLFDVSIDWLLKDTDEIGSNVPMETLDNKKTNNNCAKEKSISFRAIRAWMIVGIVITPLYVGGSVLKATDYSLFSLLW